MTSFQPYLSLSVTHSYLDAETPLAFPIIFDITDETSSWLKQHQMFIRATPGEICIFFEQSTIDTAPPTQSDIQLQFKLYSQDPFFRNYTDIPLQSPTSIARFDVNIDTEIDDTISTTLWLEIENIQGIAEQKAILTKDLSQNIVGLVNVTIPKNWHHDAHKKITLSYSHTTAYWQYHFLSLPMVENYIITDPSNAYHFDSQGYETLGCHQAVVFRSNKPLPIHRYSPIKLQLRKSKQVIYRQLPIASPKEIEILSDNGNRFRLCNIYVS